jgi:hypothetical protein
MRATWVSPSARPERDTAPSRASASTMDRSDAPPARSDATRSITVRSGGCAKSAPSGVAP